ncbi:MAG: ABC transporter ATP-binding protein [Parvibaculaceae bacterium]|nr:ABC transporter ATP-binding protein [Parvibaculaceae bacterium]
MFRTSNARAIAGFLWLHWSRYPVRLVLLAGAMLASVLFDVAFPVVSGRLVDAVAGVTGVPGPAAVEGAKQAFVLFLAQGIGFFLARRFAMFIWAWLAGDVMRNIVTEAFAYVQRFSTEWHNNAFAGATVRKVTRGMWAYDQLSDTLFIGLFPAVCIVIGITASLLLHWPVIAAMVMVSMLVYLAVTILMIRLVVTPANREMVSFDTRLGGALADAITCNAAVKAFGAERREELRFGGIATLWRWRAIKSWWLMDLTFMCQTLVLIVLQVLLLGYVLHQWSLGQATAGDVSYAMTSHLIISLYTRDIGWHLQNLQKGANEIEDAVNFVTEPDREKEGDGEGRMLAVLHGAIAFDKVTFRYANKNHDSYRDFSVEIAGGERVALVGPSGSGKSTFVKLLQRLYEAGEGRILIDGTDIASVDHASVRRAIALVPQEPILFHRSIAENIAYARPEASLEEVKEAARRARAHGFISSMPQGYGTLVGERGVKLSGGERQRIAIARAFLADAPILVLDEATSSLDAVTEAEIQAAIDELARGRTTLIIAHRLSTIRKVDRILVFDHGRIVEQGSHAQLMKRNGGVFRHLHATQLAGIEAVVED